MRQKNRRLVGVIVLIGFFGCAVTDESKLEEGVSLPAGAAAAIKAHYPEAVITDVILEREGVYEAVLEQEGRLLGEVKVMADGSLVEVTALITLSEVPAAAARVITEKAKGLKIKKLEKEVTYMDADFEKLDSPLVIYVAELIEGEAVSEITLTAEGKLLAEEGPAFVETEKQWQDTFPVVKANLVDTGRNRYFILEPGYQLNFEYGQDRLLVTVLNETKLVDGVTTRIVEEREHEGGELIEISRNYFAIDKTTNSVYYFGEDVDIYKAGKVVSHEGAWWSGVNGARFGLMMPGNPQVGQMYYQEYAPGVAMDRGENTSLTETLKTPAGSFANCLKVKETSDLEAGASYKLYAPGVGLIQDEEFVLTVIKR